MLASIATVSYFARRGLGAPVGSLRARIFNTGRAILDKAMYYNSRSIVWDIFIAPEANKFLGGNSKIELYPLDK